jgi:hypothetical protein
MGRRTRRADVAAEAFEARYQDYQYRFVEFLVAHLSDVGRMFNGDLQAVLVLAVIGQTALNAARAAAAERLSAADLPPERLSTSASRIADVTGIPRETVRRRLLLLEERGWIARAADSSVRIAISGGDASVARDLAEIDRRALRRGAGLFADLEAIVAAEGRARGRPQAGDPG